MVVATGPSRGEGDYVWSELKKMVVAELAGVGKESGHRRRVERVEEGGYRESSWRWATTGRCEERENLSASLVSNTQMM